MQSEVFERGEQENVKSSDPPRTTHGSPAGVDHDRVSSKVETAFNLNLNLKRLAGASAAATP